MIRMTLWIPALLATAVLISPAAYADDVSQYPALASLCQKNADKCAQARQRLEKACARSADACTKAKQRLDQRANGKQARKGTVSGSAHHGRKSRTNQA